MLLSPNALGIKVITYQSTIKAKCHYITRYTCTHIHKLNNHNITSCNYIIIVAEYTWSYIPKTKIKFQIFLFHLLTNWIHLPCSQTLFNDFFSLVKHIIFHLKIYFPTNLTYSEVECYFSIKLIFSSLLSNCS